MFADVEQLLVTYVGLLTDLPNVSVRMPTSPPTPFVLVERVVGGDDYITDSPTVDLAVFHPDRTVASGLAQELHAHMLRLRHTVVGGVLVDGLDTVRGPAWLDYQDENLQRYLMSYVVHLRAPVRPV